jgi:hypothetical protein
LSWGSVDPSEFLLEAFYLNPTKASVSVSAFYLRSPN